jgi:hypothetical protein
VPVAVVVEAAGADVARVEVSSPLTSRDLKLLPEGPCVVQFHDPLTSREHALLGRWFEAHPEAGLRAYGRLPNTLEFLEHYAHLGGFTLDGGYRETIDAAGLRHLPDTLRSLEIDVQLSDDDLEILARFRALRTLRLGGIRRLPDALAGLPVTDLHLAGVKTLDGIAALRDVATLRLNGVSADLTPLVTLGQLTDLTLALGGCKDLTPLVRLPRLRRVAAWRVRGLVDLGPVVKEQLEELHVAQLRHVTALPPLTRARALRRVTLEHMRGLTDLTPLREAPALRELALVEMEHLDPGDLGALAGHPTLATVNVGLGSNRKNLAARDLIRIPGNYGGHPWPPRTG